MRTTVLISHVHSTEGLRYTVLSSILIAVANKFRGMDREMRNWLQDRKLAKKTLKVLEKEHLISAEVISLLREEDLQLLMRQYSLSVGHIIALREARNALLQGEFPARQHSEPQFTEDAGSDSIMHGPAVSVSLLI